MPKKELENHLHINELCRSRGVRGGKSRLLSTKATFFVTFGENRVRDREEWVELMVFSSRRWKTNNGLHEAVLLERGLEAHAEVYR